MIKARLSLSFIFVFLFSISTLAAPKAKDKSSADSKQKTESSIALKPEVLSAKALLEDLLNRRYSQELSTKVQRDQFSLGVRLDLVEVAEKQKEKKIEAPVVEEPISDLMLGTLDPEDLMKRYAGSEQAAVTHALLSNYRVSQVEFSVGVKDNVSKETKAEVEKWLSERVKNEFGTNGKSVVSSLPSPVEKAPVAQTPIEKLEKFQSLAGQLATALAILVGVLLWRLMSSQKPIQVQLQGETKLINNEGGKSEVNVQAGAGAGVKSEDSESDRKAVNDEIAVTSAQLKELAPRLSVHLESVLRTWCQRGEDGYMRIACFAEAVGKDLGKLPIPVDAVAGISKMFSSMSEVKPKVKLEALQKAYWDIISTLNLGPESLAQPFGYLGSFNISMLNKVLVDQNPKAKTLVSLYMPNNLRARYFKSLSVEDKKELFKSAAELHEVPSTELKKLDANLLDVFKPSGDDSEMVPLDFTLQKLVASLSPIEELTILSELGVGNSSQAWMGFKRAYASLAFISEWPDEPLTHLLSQALPDEVSALLRVKGELAERFLGLCPQMTAELVRDELARPDKLNEKDRNQWIDSFSKRLKNIVDLKEVDLEEIFESKNSESTEQAA